MPHLTKEHHPIRDVLFLILFCGIFFLLFLGSRPLNLPDEGRYPSVGLAMLLHHNYVVPTLNGVPFLDKPALYYWLEAFSMKLFGVNAWAIRLPPALFGIFGCLMVYLVGFKLWNRRIGLIASFILATSPLYFFSAHYADMDLEVAVLVSAGFFCFLLAQRADEHHHKKARMGWMWMAFIFAGLACLTKGLIGIVFPMLAVGIGIALTHRWAILKKLHLITGIILFLLVTLPWYLMIQHREPTFTYYFFYYQQIERFLSGGNFNNVMPFWFYLAVLLGTLIPWSITALPGLAGIKKLWRKRQQNYLQFFVVTWVVVIVVFFSITASKIVGYILPVVPAMALLMALYIDQQLQHPSKAGRIALHVFAYLAILIGVGLLAAPYFDHQIPKNLVHYTFGTAALVFIVGAIVILWELRRQGMLRIFWTLVAMMVLFNLAALCAIPQIDHKTSLPLTNAIKPLLTPQTIVVNYYDYYQDVPVYLQRNVDVVYDWDDANAFRTDNWTRDFRYGVQHNPYTRQWMITEPQFFTLWNNHQQPVIVFASIGDYHFLKQQLSSPITLIAQYNGVVAFINQAITKPVQSKKPTFDENSL